jgi:hypothetical protein
MDLSLHIAGLDRLAELWAKAPETAERHLRQAMWEAELLLQREVVDATPTGAHQLLRKSIVAEPVQRLADGLLGVVDVADRQGKHGSVLDYAVSVELGTQPHMPPLEPLVDWAKAKFGQKGEEARSTAEAIRWKIYHEGTEGAHMFEETQKAQQAYVQGLFDRAVANIAAELGG